MKLFLSGSEKENNTLFLIKPCGHLEAESKPITLSWYKANMYYSMEETKTEVFFPHLPPHGNKFNLWEFLWQAVCTREEGHSNYLGKQNRVSSNPS